MKRFMDTELWGKEWFMELSTTEKSAWYYLINECDNVGVWTPNFKLAAFQIGDKVDWDLLVKNCNGNIKILDCGKWWLADFCTFQHPDLNENSDSNAIQSYVKLLKKHGLFEQYTNSTQTVHGQTKEREREREKVNISKQEENTKTSLVADATKNVVDFLNEKADTGYRYGAGTQEKVKRLLKKGYTVEDMRKVVLIKSMKWKGTEHEQFLRPATLFGPEKFDDYLGEWETANLHAED